MSTLLVLGASSDLGCALIDGVAGRYDTIWATYRTQNDKLDLLAQKYAGVVRPVHADLSDKEDIACLIDTIRGSSTDWDYSGSGSGESVIPDHIVHIPMSSYMVKKFVKTDEAYFESAMELAIRSSVLPLQAFLPDMKKRGSGRVVFVLSSVTEGNAPEYQTAYVTVKYALLGLMKSLASEYADTGIRINAVSPDMMDTKYLSDLSHLMIEQYAERRPNGQLLKVHDVVPHIERLLFDETIGSGLNQVVS